jgi:hypothetical protein
MVTVRFFLTALVSVTLAGIVVADDDLAPMKASCLKECRQTQDDKTFCEPYCGCTTTEMSKYHGAEREKALRSDAVVEQIGGICLGRHLTSLIAGSGCVEQCEGDETCKKKCSCIKEKTGSLGGNDKTVEFFTRFAKDDPAANKQFEEWKAACEAG